ncbi:hypothetical protein [Halobiforma nitratireducens]|uniref:Copper resistance protein D domain-containing protein n=1 Tax=Halobiforma nitratireducens JCM 10879 TaxID=1227454 RepID=M0M2X3_9EURY|nr:hypothetical protein [Halobiforma nitratireducens]EMA40016.1 hypothetical protein C446_07594 [Halobiforma nitratireducens JCM 10879]
MTFLETLAIAGHLLAVVILVGATVTMALVVLPAARRGRLSVDAVRAIGKRFALVTAVSGVAILLTGVYFTSLEYTLTALATTPSGWLTLASILVWVLLAVLLTAGTNRLAKTVAVGDARRAAERSQPWYNAATVVSVVGLLVFGTL